MTLIALYRLLRGVLLAENSASQSELMVSFVVFLIANLQHHCYFLTASLKFLSFSFFSGMHSF